MSFLAEQSENDFKKLQNHLQNGMQSGSNHESKTENQIKEKPVSGSCNSIKVNSQKPKEFSKEHSKSKNSHSSSEHKPKSDLVKKSNDSSVKDGHKDKFKSEHGNHEHKNKDPLKNNLSPHKEKDRKHEHKEHREHKEHKEHKEKKEHKENKEQKENKHKEHKDKHKSESSHKVKDKPRDESSLEKKHKSSGDKEKVKKFKEDDSSVKIKKEPQDESSKSYQIQNDSKNELKIKVKTSPMKVKEEALSEDDLPLASRKKTPVKMEEDSDDEPLINRAKVKSETKKRKSEDTAYEPAPKKVKKDSKSKTKDQKSKGTESPKKKKKVEEEQEVWKWWEEEKVDDGAKWHTLDHKGPVFAPPYEPLPDNVKFFYDGKHMKLSNETEEVAGFYARMLEHDYVTKDVFNKNFMKDWRKVMTPQEKEKITDLSKCNFKQIAEYYKMKSEERKAMTKEQKLQIKKENEEMMNIYGFCIVDGHKQKIGNFKIEPPGLFRGRGEHPKMGMLKKRIVAENIIINIGKESKPPKAPEGHKWKEVRHDNSVTWLASWNENILGSTKYIMLNPSSKLKGEKDWQKYETARKLQKHAGKIRESYQAEWKSKEMRVRQRSVALYFIDKLALRAGNEKESDETADTVGCCSLRVEHIKLHDKKGNQENVVEFDFLGKDSIRYVNSVPVEKRVFKNLKLFVENKQPEDDLFDRLNTSILNKHLNELMEGLTAKVFRTYNASKTLQEQLLKLTEEDMSIPEKLLAYNRANRAVAILCNHQRSVPKTFDKQMETLQKKLDEKHDAIKAFKKEMKPIKDAYKKSGKNRDLYEKKKKRLGQLEDQLRRLEVQQTDKEENKQIALGTSKLNYLDPRISVAWCKKWDVPIEKIYNKTQRDKFRWAIEMATSDFVF